MNLFFFYTIISLCLADVAKLVYALALGASGAIHESSSLSVRTILNMLNFLHTFEPSPILFSWKFITIYWYGFFIALAIILGLYLIIFLGKKHGVNKDDLINLSFYLIVFGILGARIYDVLLEWDYYIYNPLGIFKIWEGGLAIHGGIIAGIIVLFFFLKKRKIKGLEDNNLWNNFINLSFILTPALALGQAIGRWGNYFNQELFGLPSNLIWSIPISIQNRPIEYINKEYFHPTFLYESLGLFLIFALLMIMHYYYIKSRNSIIRIIAPISYFILYSLLRFFLEFIRIDFAPIFLGLRFPQVMSLIIFMLSIIFAWKVLRNNKK